MFSLKNFITEAKVSQRNLDKVADIFKRIVEKKLSTKLYRFGGPRGYAELKKGMGILYFYDNKRAIRLNYVNGEIESITLWKDFKLGKNGDFTIDLGGMGLLQAGKRLIDVLRNPKTGVVKAYEDLTEAYLTEAKRISPADFAVLVQRNLPPSMNLSSVPWSTITDIALANDYNIPKVVRYDTKVPGTKGKNARFDLEQLLSGEDVSGDVDKPARENEPIYYMKITAQDPNTKKFLSVKGDKRAENLLKTMAGAIEKPDVDKEMKDPNTLFGIMRNLTQIVCRGARNALLVYGGPGTGKTHTVTETIRDEGLVKGRDWFMIKGKMTTASLYQTLFMHREGALLVFDDADSVWGDADAANVLKAALDSYDERVISWVSGRTVNVSKMTADEKEEFNAKLDLQIESDPDGKLKFPSEFIYEGRIIFISNLPYEKFDTAVLNRSAKIDMTLTDDQMFMRMEGILDKLGDSAVPIDAKKEILNYLKAQNAKGLLNNPSMRTFVAAEDLYRSGLPNWKELLDYV